jgi:hypothetical protein
LNIGLGFDMQKFARHKTSVEVLKQCQDQNIPINMAEYVKGSDYITIGTPPIGYAVYSVINGRFFGVTDANIEFTSDSIQHDAEPWMQALLNFFLVE